MLPSTPIDAAIAAFLRAAAALFSDNFQDSAARLSASLPGPEWPAALDRDRILQLATSSALAEAARIAAGPGAAALRPGGASLRALAASLKLPASSSARATAEAWHAPAPLSAEVILPQAAPSSDQAALAALRQAFRQGWADLCTRAEGDAGAFEEGLLSLCERTLWSLPAPGGPPDLPLLDHARLTAALVAAAEAGDGAGQLRLLVGDLSGLQDTLFRLRAERVEGLAKLLRGRSARFQLIAEAAQRRALAAFGMPMSCALQTAGGRFLALVPAFADAEARVAGLRQKADAWLAEQYLGGLALGLALSPPFAAEDLAKSPQADAIAASLSVAAETAKLSQMADPLAQGLLPCGDLSAGPCPACDQSPARGTRSAPLPCPACAAAIEEGARLPHARAVLVGVPDDGADRLLGIDFLIPRGTARNGAARGWRWLHAGAAEPGPAALRPGPPWVARFAGPAPRARYEALARASGLPLTTPEAIAADEIKTFECLALDALEEVEGRPRGRPLLALLKGDVDRLGRLFAEGLGGFDLARGMALSRLFDLYFTLRLPHLLEREFPDSYTLYAGGDDFTLILPWRQAMALARQLRDDFRAFTGGNPDVTLSLGIALFAPHIPVSLAAREAEDRLKAAKQGGRNRVSAIEPGAMTWEDFAAALDAAERFNGWLRGGILSTGAVYQLLRLEDARRRVATGRGRGPDFGWRAKLAYHVARLRPPAGGSLRSEVVDAIRDLFGLGPDWRADRPPRPGARLALTHALYRNR
ncbi:hypothetical protein [Tabrizicola sp. YIM 78059]|uniref:type III-A CRISPR-associated protein Cas10/Csm1 n=1 Tax=Tabrizicola sp. YIM 78059 TaxID=2529861 RepID=UPI001B7D80F8|nr:hypothetical protein [Tabrizicola sp. YIM 78059]